MGGTTCPLHENHTAQVHCLCVRWNMRTHKSSLLPSSSINFAKMPRSVQSAFLRYAANQNKMQQSSMPTLSVRLESLTKEVDDVLGTEIQGKKVILAKRTKTTTNQCVLLLVCIGGEDADVIVFSMEPIVWNDFPTVFGLDGWKYDLGNDKQNWKIYHIMRMSEEYIKLVNINQKGVINKESLTHVIAVKAYIDAKKQNENQFVGSVNVRFVRPVSDTNWFLTNTVNYGMELFHLWIPDEEQQMDEYMIPIKTLKLDQTEENRMWQQRTPERPNPLVELLASHRDLETLIQEAAHGHRRVIIVDHCSLDDVRSMWSQKAETAHTIQLLRGITDWVQQHNTTGALEFLYTDIPNVSRLHLLVTQPPQTNERDAISQLCVPLYRRLHLHQKHNILHCLVELNLHHVPQFTSKQYNLNMDGCDSEESVYMQDFRNAIDAPYMGDMPYISVHTFRKYWSNLTLVVTTPSDNVNPFPWDALFCSIRMKSSDTWWPLKQTDEEKQLVINIRGVVHRPVYDDGQGHTTPLYNLMTKARALNIRVRIYAFFDGSFQTLEQKPDTTGDDPMPEWNASPTQPMVETSYRMTNSVEEDQHTTRLLTAWQPEER